ncbi:MAG: hypothetical protein CMO55_15090 [Verrucomicrobiales bacterium]|nr:hypothetical protein [Verrucomicrobiales bacterium]
MHNNKLRFYGEIEGLIDLIREFGFSIVSIEENEGKHTLRTKKGGVLNWWPATKTVQCQGKEEAKEALRSKLSEILKKGGLNE